MTDNRGTEKQLIKILICASNGIYYYCYYYCNAYGISSVGNYLI